MSTHNFTKKSILDYQLNNFITNTGSSLITSQPYLIPKQLIIPQTSQYIELDSQLRIQNIITKCNNCIKHSQ